MREVADAAPTEAELIWKKRSNVYWALRAARSYVGKARFGEPEYRELGRWVTKGAVAVDVGANVGVYTFRLARLTGRSGKVIAVEPLPFHARRLRGMTRLFRLSQVTIVEAALGAECGRASIVVPNRFAKTIDDGQAHIAGVGESGAITVDLAALDTLLAGVERLDFLKLDVEGAECGVIDGGAGVLTRFRPVIVCESQEEHSGRYGRSVQDLFDRLRGFHYRSYVISGGALQSIHAPDSRVINYVFLPA